jgi:hypothetical protein
LSHVEQVRKLYEAFGRGDIPTIIGALDPDIEWEYGEGDTEVPWLKKRRGRTGVIEFFEALRSLEFHLFEPKRFLADESLVVVLVNVHATVKATGKSFAQTDEVHLWHFNAQGQPARFAHRVDTHQHVLAVRG